MTEERLLTHIVRFAIILLLGLGFCAVTRTRPRFGWIGAAFGMVIIHDFFLSSGYGNIPPIMSGLNWNWTGKFMAFATGLVFVLLLGRKRCGLTFSHKDGSLAAVWVCVVLTCAAIGSAIIWGGGRGSVESILFRLTMPGFEEEVFYRGALLTALVLAFPIRWKIFGAETSPAFLLNSLLFGMIHGFWINDTGLNLNWGPVLFSFISGLIFTWLRERTGSLVLPIYMHNAWNTAYAIL